MKSRDWKALTILLILAVIATILYVAMISGRINRYWLDHSIVRDPRGLPPERNERP